ncbi:hypothetical protein F7734_14475, partial [Scytonema sp. UIC 10036]|uniref:nSTAND1 domain-containing NTPase n=1 Tax=Scytonema sp. UIC 10036 TaxID=2304196 RepID=UPI0012DA72F2
MTKINGGEKWNGQIFIILDQFEEYFQQYPQEKDPFVQEFAQIINSVDLTVNFLISIRSDEFYKIERQFKKYIYNPIRNIELPPLDINSAQEAIEKPIERYNFIQCLRNCRLTILTGDKSAGKSLMIQEGLIPSWRKSISSEDSSSSESFFCPAIIFDTWDCDSLYERVKQHRDKIGDLQNKHQLIIFDHFEQYIESHPLWEKELNKVLTELPVNLLISTRDNYLNYL